MPENHLGALCVGLHSVAVGKMADGYQQCGTRPDMYRLFAYCVLYLPCFCFSAFLLMHDVLF